jgi:AcrR family transcriptional regulator
MATSPRELQRAPTGRHGLPADVVAAYQRERLLAATIELVAKRGYRGTSVDHIVKAARVGYTAFYELFEGKEACFLAAFELVVSEYRERIVDAVPAESLWPEQISIGVATLVQLIVADPARARVALVEAQAAGPQLYSRFEDAVDIAAPKLREGRALNPAAAALSATLEETILGGIVWIIHQRLVKAETEQVSDLGPVLIRTALSPYLGDAEAKRLAKAAEAAS